ncbi:MAG: gliding motility-associated C-terminal domain-containing protein [Bacteroidetes bacterium]|nr:gliding motility-associated C-terminal domain-containing protein [Bacteroidota bacterium]
MGLCLMEVWGCFSQSAISRPDGKPFIGITPQVLNATNNFITDTLNWVEIKGKFIAQGNEQFVTLGFFSDTSNLDTLRLNNPFPPSPTLFQSYYFIDDCHLTETGQVYQYPNVFSPNGDGVNDEWNPSLFNGESVKIFNRWGIEVFEITGNNQKWDGRTTSGTECVDGIYFYVINNGSKETNTIKKGFIQLVR